MRRSAGAAEAESSNNGEGFPDLLLLFINQHGRLRSLPGMFRYLHMRDIIQLFCLSRDIRQKMKRVEYRQCVHDDKDYMVPFPGFPGLLLPSIIADASTTATRNDNDINNARLGLGIKGREGGLFQHQLASLEAMHNAEKPEQGALDYGVLRGGILGDAPGLGKTITLLALITNTAGRRPIPPPQFWNQEKINESWKNFRINDGGCEAILKALKPFRQVPGYRTLAASVSPPYKSPNVFPTIDDLERHVISQMKPVASIARLEQFRQEMIKMRAGFDKQNRKRIMNVQDRRILWERRLVQSSGTLIIVPDALLEHWFQQIHQHLELEIFSDIHENVGNDMDYDESTSSNQSEETPKRNSRKTPMGVVYLDGIGDLAQVAGAERGLRNISIQDQFLAPTELTKYLIVVTTFSRCKSEYSRKRSRSYDRKDAVGRDEETSGQSPILRVRWLRLVVDEGHELGLHPTGSNVTRFINQIAAERRWVLSGTPTTGNEDNANFSANALDQLQRLLYFIRHPEYGQIPSNEHDAPRRSCYADYYRKEEESREMQLVEKAKSKWDSEIKIPFLNKNVRAKNKLLYLLKKIMVMHRKEDINLPKPIFRQIEVTVPVEETAQRKIINDYISRGDRNYDLAAEIEEYLKTQEFQSCVDEAMANYIVNRVTTARVSRRIEGNTMKATNRKLLDQRPVKAVVYSSEKNNLLSVTEQIIRELDSENIAEMYESPNIGDMSYELSRFRTGLRECKVCPICGLQTDPISGRKDQCKNTLLEVVLISDPEVRILIERERIYRTLNVEPGRTHPEPLSAYSKLSGFWKENDELQVDIRDPHPVLTKRKSEEEWKKLGSDTCRALAGEDGYVNQDWYFGPLPQFEEGPDNHLVAVKLAKWQPCWHFHSRARWYKGPTLASQPLEKIKEDCFLLSLDARLSHGLDLSFVTHLFLLEPIDDAALLEQVTSRAHRLGATGPVIVETVNPNFELNRELQELVNRVETSWVEGIQREKEIIIKKIVCQYCYRRFLSFAEAEDHEKTTCPRNPQNRHLGLCDRPFHISSLYREIRPPLAPTSASVLE